MVEERKENSGPAPQSTHSDSKPNSHSLNPKTLKIPPREAQEDHKSHSEEPSQRSFKFKRNRQAAEVTGNQGGTAVSVLPLHELSLKMQAAWRGK